MQTTKQPNELGYVRLPLQMLSDPEISSDACIVYSFMLNRYRYFVELAKTRCTAPEYYESIPAISERTKVPRRSINRILNVLREKGYIESKLIRKGTSFNNLYVVHDKHGIYSEPKTKISVAVHKPVSTATNVGMRLAQQIDDRPAWMKEPDENLPF